MIDWHPLVPVWEGFKDFLSPAIVDSQSETYQLTGSWIEISQDFKIVVNIISIRREYIWKVKFAFNFRIKTAAWRK